MMMMFPSENDLMLMDENDYKDHMLLTSLDVDDDEHDIVPATLLDEDTMTFDQEDDANEFTTLCRKVTDTHEKEEGSKPTAPVSSSDDVPGEYDVLCGQSRNCASHSGNKRFQSILDSYAPSYSKVNKKEEKMALTKEIVSKIQQFGGRFLKKDNNNKAGGGASWVEISDVAARDKISHALRTKVSSRKKRAEREAKESTVTSSRPTHRRKSTAAKRQRRHRRRSSCNSTSESVNTFASQSFDDTVPTPMSSASSSVMEELMRRQKEIFASLVAESEIECKEGEIHPLKRE